MKTTIFVFINTFVFFLMLSINLFGQEVIIKSKTGEKKLNLKENLRSIKPESFPNQINRIPSSGIRQSSNAWKLNEDFESGTFPPAGWSLNPEWQESPYSSHGIGNYSVSYCNFCCTQNFNYMNSPQFTPSVTGDKLFFDVAYAPKGDSSSNITDYLEIYYWDQVNSSYEYLITYDKDSLSTAPPTNFAFFPESTQWKTISIYLPENASILYFYSIDQCGNNIYLDNIKVGQEPDNQQLLSEDFSGVFPPNNWSPGNWQYNSISAFGNGSGCTFRELYYCDYNTTAFLYTPEFLAVNPGAQLIFDHAYASFDNYYYDDLEIYGTSDGGMTFDLIASLSGDPNAGELATAPPTYNYFVPQNTEWANKIIDLPAGTSQLRFTISNGCSNNLYLDNIAVQNGAVNTQYDAEVMAVFSKSKLPLGYGAPDTISAVVYNHSSEPISPLKIYLEISGTNIFLDSVETSVLPGQYKTVRFKPFNPVLHGPSDVTVYVGDDLENSNNNKTVSANINSNTYRYSDSVGSYSAIAYTQTGSFLNKYRMNGTGQVTKVRVQVYDDANAGGQIFYGVVLDKYGNLVGRSSDYKLKASDANTLLTFNITDPKPSMLNNSEFYAGVVQTATVGEGYAFVTGMNFYSADYSVLRKDANFFGGAGPVGTNLFPYELNYSPSDFVIEADVQQQHAVDVGIADAGLKYEQYFSSNTFTPESKVFNAGIVASTFTVTRIHPYGSYSSTKTVTNLAPGATATVTFDPWTFPTNNIEQPVSIYTGNVAGDGNTSNNSMNSVITPRVAKELCVLWQSEIDRDSIIRAINADGRFVNNFDTVRINYTGSLRPWKTVYCLLKSETFYAPWLRDSMKSYLDFSNATNKRSLLIFSDYVYNQDPERFYSTVADTVFYRRYLKSKTINDNWIGNTPASGKRFRGSGIFSGIAQDSLIEVNDYGKPGLIKAVNGGTAAFKPKSVSLSGNDSCNAVCYSGTNYNTFYMTNRYSDLRYSQGSPVSSSVFSKTINWINTATSAYTLNLSSYVEGFYNAGINKMTPDTMRVYLRNSSNPYAIIDSAKSVLDSTGTGIFAFNNAVNNTGYFIQVKHRNSVETWSSAAQSFTGGIMNYNFTSSASQAFGNNIKQIDTSPVRFGIYSGDVNKDGFVNLTDVISVYNDAGIFVNGYKVTDVNGDNTTDLTDVIITNNNSTAFVSLVKP